MTVRSDLSTQVYQVFIKATPERIWAAITEPDETKRYFYGARIRNTPERHLSNGPDGTAWGDSPVLEWDPPRLLVHEWRSLYRGDLASEAPSRVRWEIESRDDGVCMLTVTHDRLEDSPVTAESVSGGWAFVLNGLKTLLETGSPLVDFD